MPYLSDRCWYFTLFVSLPSLWVSTFHLIFYLKNLDKKRESKCGEITVWKIDYPRVVLQFDILNSYLFRKQLADIEEQRHKKRIFSSNQIHYCWNAMKWRKQHQLLEFQLVTSFPSNANKWTYFDTVSTFYVALLYCEVVKRVWMLLIPINLAK